MKKHENNKNLFMNRIDIEENIALKNFLKDYLQKNKNFEKKLFDCFKCFRPK